MNGHVLGLKLATGKSRVYGKKKKNISQRKPESASLNSSIILFTASKWPENPITFGSGEFLPIPSHFANREKDSSKCSLAQKITSSPLKPAFS